MGRSVCCPRSLFNLKTGLNCGVVLFLSTIPNIKNVAALLWKTAVLYRFPIIILTFTICIYFQMGRATLSVGWRPYPAAPHLTCIWTPTAGPRQVTPMSTPVTPTPTAPHPRPTPRQPHPRPSTCSPPPCYRVTSPPQARGDWGWLNRPITAMNPPSWTIRRRALPRPYNSHHSSCRRSQAARKNEHTSVFSQFNEGLSKITFKTFSKAYCKVYNVKTEICLVLSN